MMSRIYIFVILLAWAISFSAHATVTATVNKNTLGSGDTLQLTLQRDGSGDSQPDLAPLKKEFDLLGTSSGSNIQIINGHMSTQTQVTVLLSPKHEGKLQIPPLHWGGEQSQALEVSAGAASTGGASGPAGAQSLNDSPHVFLTTALDQTQPYVQSAVVLTVRLYADQSLLQASLDLPAGSDILVKPFGKDTRSGETRNGRTYQVVERKYLLFPQRSGKLKLDGPVLDAQVADNSGNNSDPLNNLFRQMPFGGMVNASRPIRVRAKPVELNVLARPASASSTYWLPAQKVTLEESGDTARHENITVHVGEPLTRHLKITALGLTGTQLPDPNVFMQVPDGIRAYPDQASFAESPQENTVLGSREQSIALIASQPGRYELPPIRLSWWDTQHNEKREISLPARSVQVVAASAGNAAVIPPASAEAAPLLNQGSSASAFGQTSRTPSSPLWMWLSFVFAVLWLGTTQAWWRARRHMARANAATAVPEKKQDIVRGGSEFKAIKQACADNDAQAARKHLLAWASTVWAEAPPLGINELARRCSDTTFAEALKQLDRACYTGSAWQGAALAQALPASPVKVHKEPARQLLPELYE